MDEIKTYIPPLAVGRIVAMYHFEGGGFVALVSSSERETTELLDAIQRQIDLKREEIKNGGEGPAKAQMPENGQ